MSQCGITSFVTLCRMTRVSRTRAISWGAQLTRGPRGDARRYLRRNVFFNVFYDTFGRANGRTRQMTKNDDNSARLRRRTVPCRAVPLHRCVRKSLVNAFSRRWRENVRGGKKKSRDRHARNRRKSVTTRGRFA